MSISPGGMQRKTAFYYLNSFIAIVMMFGFPHLPLIAPLTPLGMKIMGIFLGVIYAWSTVGIIWPALLGLIALGFSGYATVPEVFQSGYGGDSYLFVFFILIFAAIVDKAGVTEIIANWVVSREFARGKPWVLTTLLLSAAYLVAALVSVTPAIIICWGILYKLCQVYGFSHKDKYPKLMVIGITYAGLMGQGALPYKVLPVILMGILTKQTGAQINFVSFTILAVAIGYSTVLGYIALCKWVYKPDVSPILKSGFVFRNTLQLNKYQKQVICLLGALIGFLFLPGILPGDLWLTKFLKQLGNTGIVVALLSFAAFLKKKDYSGFVDFVELIRSGVPWQSLFLLATALPLAGAMSSDSTGVKELFIQLLEPFLSTNAGPAVFVVLFFLITVLLTCVMGDVVVGLIFIPLVCAYSPSLGVSPEMMTIALSITCLMGIVLPSSSPVAALLHGNSEWVSSTEIYRYSIPHTVLAALIGAAVCLVVGGLLF